MPQESPLDDFRALLGRMPSLDPAGADAVSGLFRRQGAGGSRLAEVASLFASISGGRPAMNRPSLALFAGAHGLARHGVSARRIDATLAAVAACGSGDAAVSHLCAANMIGLKVYDLALHMPTGDIAAAPAMDARNAAATIAFGMEAIAGGTDCLLVGSIGSTGDETVAAALFCGLLGGVPSDWLADDSSSPVRIALVEAALARHRAALGDPLAVLSTLGGREFAAMTGAILAARIEKVPAILDGTTALAAASVLYALDPGSIAHCILADAPDKAARSAAARLGLTPILAPGLAAGEGTAAALAVSVVRDAIALHAGFSAHRAPQRH
jgi:nicotinate-nucleotide--dimethylbenzimidazole phosphoribosyltransferase